MKVTITPEAKKWLTLDELAPAKEIIQQMKEDEYSAADYLKMGVGCWLRETAAIDDFARRVIEATAEIARNSRIWDAFSDGSGRLDVWIRGIVETGNGFLKLGTYLTDIWNIGPDEFNSEYPAHCYARYAPYQK